MSDTAAPTGFTVPPRPPEFTDIVPVEAPPKPFVNTLVCEIPHGPIDPAIPANAAYFAVLEDGSTRHVCAYHYPAMSKAGVFWQKL